MTLTTPLSELNVVGGLRRATVNLLSEYYFRCLCPPVTAIHVLEDGMVWDNYGSLKVFGNGTIQQSAYEFLLTFRGNYVPILHDFSNWYHR